MPKFDFKILAKKKGPLPVWAWALIVAGLIYMLYRHFQSAGGTSTNSSGGSPSAMDVGTSPSDNISPAPGDLLNNGAGNSGNGLEFGDRNIASSVNDFVDQTLADAAARVAAANDAAQGTDPVASGTDTTQAGADLGLTHISGPYWWDSVNRKLVKIPGSGGAKKGSGQKVVPNTQKAGGAKTKPGKPKKNRHTRVKQTGGKPRWIQVGKNKPSPPKDKPHTVKGRVLPKAQSPRLTKAQLAAINRAHHPAPKQPPKKNVGAQRTIRPGRGGGVQKPI